MKIFEMKNLSLLFLLTLGLNIFAQSPQVNLQLNWEIPFNFAYPALTIEHDKQGQDVIYVAAKEQGLLIYDISSTPNKIKTITKNQLDTLDVMNVTQEGNYLYLALGNSFTNGEYPGMAIVDVTDPTQAFVTDIWKKYSGAKSGGGIVKIEGNYAYFGGMGDGLIVFDVSNKNNISIAGSFTPSISFPDPNPDPAKYNARGMAVKNDIVYLCYDAGGIRIINTTNKQNIIETGRYSNPAMNGKPRAYNNLALNDTLLYVAVDYAGVEILNIKDTSDIKLVSWWNPWGTSNWFASRGHANEIQFDKNSNLLFIATGKSDMNVVSVENPAQPDSITVFGGINNSQGTWGVGLYQDKIYLGYIFVPLCIPFCSNWGGVKEISWTVNGTNIQNLESNELIVYPNPNEGDFNFNYNSNGKSVNIIVSDAMGKEVYRKNGVLKQQNNIQLNLNSGIYILSIKDGDKILNQRLLIN